MKRVIFLLTGISLLFLMLSACDHGPLGIYYSLEVETSVSDKEIPPNEITVGSMAKVGSSYYLAAGSVYTRSDAIEAEWTVETPPEGFLLSTELVSAFGNVYAIFTSQDGASSVLHTLSGDSWTPVTDTDIASARSDALVVTNNGASDTLFVTVRNSGSEYSLLYSTDGTSFIPVTLPAGFVLTSPISDGAWVDSASQYWLITRNTILAGASPATLAESSVKPSTTSPFGGIFFSDLLNVPFLSTRGGETSNVYVYSGGSWITSSTNDGDLTDFDELTIGGNTIVVVGSDNGYKEMIFSGTTVGTAVSLVTPGLTGSGSVTTNANYLNTDLANTVVQVLFTDVVGSETYLFAGTSGEGLWINFFQESSSQRVWGRE